MAVYRCNHCGLMGEETGSPEGNKIPCPSCAAIVTLFPTALYLNRLFDRYHAVRRELEALRRQEDETDEEQTQDDQVAQGAPPELHAELRETLQNTLLLATPEQHKPLEDWFATRKISARCDYSLVDTSGFFDEAAILIGDNYPLLGATLNQLRFGYGKGWSWLNVELGKLGKKEKQVLKATLRQLYSYTFFARYQFQHKKDVIGLALQPAKPVQVFLTGGWLEWLAFIRLLECCLENEVAFSCARGVRIEFPDKEQRELDVAFLLQKDNQDIPVVVECKTGEFRGELKKYSDLQKRLQLDSECFIICNPDLDDEKAAGLTSMYGLTFCNLGSFGTHLERLVRS